ncbi:MAG: sensor histidine kinase [Pseudobdellovibrionaceae bacterium]
MRIEDWYRKKSLRPLVLVAVLIFTLCGFLFFKILQSENQYRNSLLDQLQQSASIALEQKNLILLEKIFLFAKTNHRSLDIHLCKEDKILLSTAEQKNQNCPLGGETLVSLIDQPVQGFANYHLVMLHNRFDFSKTQMIILLAGLFCLLWTWFLLTGVYKHIHRALIEPLQSDFKISPFLDIQELQVLSQKIKDIEKIKLQRQSEEAILSLARQVAHDIRSPLSALNMVVSVANSLPEAQRLMIRNASQRINDIANDLLHQANRKDPAGENSVSQSGSAGIATSGAEVDSKSGATKSPTGGEATSHGLRHLASTATTPKTQSTLVIALVDALVSEKRIQFRDKINIQILAELNQGYGLFIQANPTDLARVLSNMINNAVEAFTDAGQITVKVFAQQNNQQVVITITDNGKGIPAHILEKLGQKGITHGKSGSDSGSGLGVYHAKQSIEAVGGSFSIASQEGHGTTITLSFAKNPAPDWFIEKILVQGQQPIIVCDDDISIHDIWKDRFDKITSFTSGQEMIQWVENEKLQGSPIHHTGLFLLDYELLGQKYNGLDLSEELQLKNVILVTSRYEDSEIRKRCQILGIQLIPKTMAHFVPIVRS